MRNYIIFCFLANLFGCMMFYWSDADTVSVMLALSVLVVVVGCFQSENFYYCKLSSEYSDIKNGTLLTVCQIMLWCVIQFIVYSTGYYIHSSTTHIIEYTIWGVLCGAAFTVLVPALKGIRLIIRDKTYYKA